MTDNGKYQIILCDPPWRYRDARPSRAVENHYPTMSLAEICALDVGAICAKDAALFMWATSPKLAEAMRVMEAWGFDYVTSDIWVKLPPDKHRAQLSLDDCLAPLPSKRLGMGYWFRIRHELILVGRRGKAKPPAIGNRFESVFFDNVTKHSRKPPVARQRIVAMFPDARRIELFARDRAPGWDIWGNQVDSDVQLSTRADK